MNSRVEQLAARLVHTQEVVGSSPAPATSLKALGAFAPWGSSLPLDLTPSIQLPASAQVALLADDVSLLQRRLPRCAKSI